MKSNKIIGFDDDRHANKNEQNGLLIFGEFSVLHHTLITVFAM
jgi:hypothetical protein